MIIINDFSQYVSKVIQNYNNRLHQNVFHLNKRKDKKFTDTVIHLIKRLNEVSYGFITGIQLKAKIKEYLNLDVSVSKCLFYRHKIIGTNFRRSRFQPKIFTDDEKKYRLTVARLIKRHGVARLMSTDESKKQTGPKPIYHNRLPSTKPKCVGFKPAGYKSLNVWCGITSFGHTRPIVNFNNISF